MKVVFQLFFDKYVKEDLTKSHTWANIQYEELEKKTQKTKDHFLNERCDT